MDPAPHLAVCYLPIPDTIGSADLRTAKVWALANVGNQERPLAPASDLGVDAHRVPVFGAVPADLVLLVVCVDLYRASRSGEVDQVYVLVVGPDVLQLDTGGAVELNGVLDILPPLPDELDLHAGLLQDLAHGRLVGKLVSLYVTAWRQPHPQLAVVVQQDLPVPYHEDRHREVPARTNLSHGPQGTPYPQRPVR